ncbi:MAG: MFS transporter [Alphaproteobacteria bacterium]|nr:MFS transporter [Alphaproteobacteria bacterium]
MDRDRINFFFLNMGHFLDHFCMLVFATVAALRLATEWNMTYAELIPYATPGFVAFGVCAIPAGWLADKWSREGMMTIFFVGIGLCTILTAFADTPLEIGMGLFTVGVFAAIYHPVGIAMVVHGREKTGVPLAVNGIFGNMGVAAAALVTGYLIDTVGWRSAFIAPGVLAIALGLAYAAFVYSDRHARAADIASGAAAKKAAAGTLTLDRATLVRVFSIIIFSTAVGGIIFQSTTFALPKIFDERLTDIASTATAVGGYAFLVFALAAFAQLVVGYLVDRYSVRVVFAAVAGFQAVFFAIMLNLTGVAALLVAFGFMLVVFGQIPINDVLVARITRSEWRSRIYAVRYIVTLSVAATAVPIIAGVHSSWGFSALFLVMAGAATLIFFAVLLLPRTAAVTGRPAAAPAE